MTLQRWMYRRSEGGLERVAPLSSAYLTAWEYEAVSEDAWPVSDPDVDRVRRWRTRRPDLAPAELLVGEIFDGPPSTHLVRSLPLPGAPLR